MTPTAINEHLITLRLSLPKKNYTTLISTSAPTLEADEKAKNQFYQQLSNIIVNIPPNEKLFLLGDFNASVGNDYCLWEKVIGKESVWSCNSTGHLLLGLCMEHNLFITNVPIFYSVQDHMDASPIQTLASDRQCHHTTTRQKRRPRQQSGP